MAYSFLVSVNLILFLAGSFLLSVNFILFQKCSLLLFVINVINASGFDKYVLSFIPLAMDLCNVYPVCFLYV